LERQALATLRLLTADNQNQQTRLNEIDRLMQAMLDMLARAIEIRQQQ
jgi:CHASE3 domain sensor protein